MLRRERGDTIVEVMIVLAVLGMALAISYATANRALLNARQAQESARATAIAQSQLEQLRTRTDVYIPTSFCLDQASGALQAWTAASTNCDYDNNLYNVKVDLVTQNGGTNHEINTFTVLVTWPDVLGEGNDTVTMQYRLYKPAS